MRPFTQAKPRCASPLGTTEQYRVEKFNKLLTSANVDLGMQGCASMLGRGGRIGVLLGTFIC